MSGANVLRDGGSANSCVQRLEAARARVASIDGTAAYDEFVAFVRGETPWRFKGAPELDRYLHSVRHHLDHFVPRLLASLHGGVQTVFDFGCGSGGGSVAMALLFPEARFHGVDISAHEVAIGCARARLYGVEDRCTFEVIEAGSPFPAENDAYDLCTCCSVLEYVVDRDTRRFCVQEMGRVLSDQGVLFMSVPNRLYPVELHSRKPGWNYFPKLLKATSVGASAWEIRALAHPHVLKLVRTPIHQLFTPWTNFCLQKRPNYGDFDHRPS